MAVNIHNKNGSKDKFKVHPHDKCSSPNYKKIRIGRELFKKL